MGWSGHVDVSVGVAIRFLDEERTVPYVHNCGDYQGSGHDVKVTISCLEEAEGADPEGLTAYAVYATFHGDLAAQPTTAVCQIDIAMHESINVYQ